jgi:hypothetical protein
VIDEPTEDELVALLQAVQDGDERGEPLDNRALAAAIGVTLDDVVRYVAVARERRLMWGVRAGGRPAPWYTDMEVTVQGRRFLDRHRTTRT